VCAEAAYAFFSFLRVVRVRALASEHVASARRPGTSNTVLYIVSQTFIDLTTQEIRYVQLFIQDRVYASRNHTQGPMEIHHLVSLYASTISIF